MQFWGWVPTGGTEQLVWGLGFGLEELGRLGASWAFVVCFGARSCISLVSRQNSFPGVRGARLCVGGGCWPRKASEQQAGSWGLQEVRCRGCKIQAQFGSGWGAVENVVGRGKACKGPL